MIWKQCLRSLKHKLIRPSDTPARTKAVRSMDVQLNTLCNADCFFCVAHDNSPTRIDFEQFQKLARHVHMETVEELILTGGEPTLNRDLEQIVRFMDKHYPRANLRVITNAIHLPLNLIDSLLLTNVASVHVSMNASNAADYFKIARVDKFENVIENIRALVEGRKKLQSSAPTLCASLVLVKQNRTNILPFVHMACELGFDSVCLLTANLAPGVSESSQLDRTEDLDGIFGEARKIASLKGIELGLPSRPVGGTNPNTCVEPWRKVFVAAGGEVNPCCGYDFSISRDQYLRGNLLQQDLREFWYTGLYASLRKGLKEANPLPGCRACYKQILQMYES